MTRRNFIKYLSTGLVWAKIPLDMLELSNLQKNTKCFFRTFREWQTYDSNENKIEPVCYTNYHDILSWRGKLEKLTSIALVQDLGDDKP